MRTYGKVYERDENGHVVPGSVGVWVTVETNDEGFNDAVMLTTLAQVLQLNLNESPFFAKFGIPAKESVQQQIFPDFWVWQTQKQFSQFFASLIIAKEDSPTPTYRINVVTNQGVSISQPIAV